MFDRLLCFVFAGVPASARQHAVVGCRGGDGARQGGARAQVRAAAHPATGVYTHIQVHKYLRLFKDAKCECNDAGLIFFVFFVFVFGKKKSKHSKAEFPDSTGNSDRNPEIGFDVF